MFYIFIYKAKFKNEQKNRHFSPFIFRNMIYKQADRQISGNHEICKEQM